MKAEPRYEISIWWSQQDDAWLAEVPDLPGCMADGADRKQALDNVQTAIEAWLAAARELGRPIPDPRERPHAV